jgi:hypothetical protein
MDMNKVNSIIAEVNESLDYCGDYGTINYETINPNLLQKTLDNPHKEISDELLNEILTKRDFVDITIERAHLQYYHAQRIATLINMIINKVKLPKVILDYDLNDKKFLYIDDGYGYHAFRACLYTNERMHVLIQYE